MAVLLKRFTLLTCLLLTGCTQMNGGTAKFGEDLDFLKKHTDVVVLSDKTGGAQIALAPAYQGRVMTSTAQGLDGISFGWINKKLIASGKTQKHMNAFGGEERFWMGPEGGQFALYFAPGVPFDFDHWQVPPVIDTEPFELVSKTADKAVFTKTCTLQNYSETKFDIKIDRTVRLLSRNSAAKKLKINLPDSVGAVAYETLSKITNTGRKKWTKKTGLLSIWILSMFNPSPETTVVIGFEPGPESELGAKVNDSYFGKVPPERLVVKDDRLFFKADGKYRSKIGLSPLRAKPVFGSYDAKNNVLTIIQYSKPKGITDYVNSMWQIQDKPFAGDVINSYNDGPNEAGDIMGPFYEIESSSPALELAPGRAVSHTHRVFHFAGAEPELNKIAVETLNVTLDEIKNAL